MTTKVAHIMHILCRKITMLLMEVLIKFKIGLVSNQMPFVHIQDRSFHSLIKLKLQIIKTTIVMKLQNLMYNVKIGISHSKLIKTNLLLYLLL